VLREDGRLTGVQWGGRFLLPKAARRPGWPRWSERQGRLWALYGGEVFRLEGNNRPADTGRVVSGRICRWNLREPRRRAVVVSNGRVRKWDGHELDQRPGAESVGSEFHHHGDRDAVGMSGCRKPWIRALSGIPASRRVAFQPRERISTRLGRSLFEDREGTLWPDGKRRCGGSASEQLARVDMRRTTGRGEWCFP